MELHQWLDQEVGRASWLAEKLNRTRAAVAQWRENGVPLTLMPEIVYLTDGKVTIKSMVEHAIRCKTVKA